MTIEERLQKLEGERSQDTLRLDWLQTHLDAPYPVKMYLQPSRFGETIREQIDRYIVGEYDHRKDSQ